MIVLLNGPLGIGKSTLAEALAQEVDGCVMLNGDSLVAMNPPADDDVDVLHTILAWLVVHHRGRGYRSFVIDHLWSSAGELTDLTRRLIPLDPEIRCFLLTLPVAENLARIQRRARARALDELDFERATVARERAALERAPAGSLGEPFDVSGPVKDLAPTMLRRLGMEG